MKEAKSISKQPDSFHVVSIDDNHHQHHVQTTESQLGLPSSIVNPLEAKEASQASSSSTPPRTTPAYVHRPLLKLPEGDTFMQLSPRGRLLALSIYLLITGLSSLYFCLVQAGMDKIELCDSIASCLFYSTQGWPAMGEQSKDLVLMSYLSGTISVLGGILGAFGIFAAYKESASKVRLFARVWWFMIGIFIGSTLLTLMLTVVHRERYLDQCAVEHDAVKHTQDCLTMYVAALLGSLIGCLIGATMIWCYGDDVVKYSDELQGIKNKTRPV
ncbi:hypothetical protein EDD11_003560 [Mortierella claussenii]|nr:hypothetical protein EDD11_003560 [Mortierella claussenii]